ncbi:MAG TPA: hypothetical protein VHN12_09460 [Geobacteraceae bacterium]|nr:hypothetical protein [Geobacteraceae bacterium]
MPFKRSMVIAGFFTLLAGCTGKDIREGIYQGMYDGARIENQKELSPGDRAAKPEMDYQQYKNERKERLEENR